MRGREGRGARWGWLAAGIQTEVRDGWAGRLEAGARAGPAAQVSAGSGAAGKRRGPRERGRG